MSAHLHHIPARVLARVSGPATIASAVMEANADITHTVVADWEDGELRLCAIFDEHDQDDESIRWIFLPASTPTERARLAAFFRDAAARLEVDQ